MCIVSRGIQPSLICYQVWEQRYNGCRGQGVLGSQNMQKMYFESHAEKYNCYPVFLNADTAQSYMEFCDEFCIQYFLVRWQLIAGQIPQ